MSFYSKITYAFFICLSLCSGIIEGKSIRKLEIAPAYIHIDVIAMKKTVQELDMPGVRGDFSSVSEKGWMGKASIIYGKEGNGEFTSAAFSFGRYIPFKEKWAVIPSIGVSYTDMKTIIPIHHPILGNLKVRDSFKALAPFLGIEGIYSFKENLRLAASIQYAWSHPHTNIVKLFSSKSDAQGPNYGLLLEYDLNKLWSVNLGAGYNESFSHEKNGLRARGIKVGLARWF